MIILEALLLFKVYIHFQVEWIVIGMWPDSN